MDGDFAIIAAIAANRGVSFELAEHLQALGIAMPRSTLYRRLRCLIGTGLLQEEPQRAATRGSRRSLGLTPEGYAWLAGEVGRALRTEPLESSLFALALGCVPELDRDTLASVLKPRVASATLRLTDERRALTSESASAGYWGRIRRERQIAHLQADIDWLESVLRPRLTPKRPPRANEAS